MNNNSKNLKSVVDTFFAKEVISEAQKYTNNYNVIKCANSLASFIKEAEGVKTNEEIAATLLLTAELIAKDEMLK